ncbi:MAG: hypothetical protein EBR30_21275 [Cytophagia bacterium]|nr:hypothetical protein [Cytophagia bacterium]NBW37498.1 hypothetical protein [Cytophagia bacterium]
MYEAVETPIPTFIDHVARVKRGRGRPPKNEIVTRWSQIESGRKVAIVGITGDWSYVKMTDNGESVVVVGGPNGHTRTFPHTRVTVFKPADSDE